MWDPKTVDVVEALIRDGIAVAPGMVDKDRCAELLTAVDRARSTPSPYYRCLSPAGVPAVESDLFRWRDIPEIRELVGDPALASMAGAFLGVEDPLVLEDQWFWSQPGSSTNSPWHQDEPYHPLDRPFLTVWIPLTDVPAGLGLKGVRGSHEETIYSPIEFSAHHQTLSDSVGSLPPVPDVDSDPERYPVIAPSCAVGDAVLLDSRTLHAAGGECPADFVRLSIRYAHPDTRRRPRAWPTASFWDDWNFPEGALLPAAGFPAVSDLLTAEGVR